MWVFHGVDAGALRSLVGEARDVQGSCRLVGVSPSPSLSPPRPSLPHPPRFSQIPLHLHPPALSLSAAGPSPAAGLSGSDVLLCLHVWLKLDPAGAGGLCLAPGEIRAAAPQLLPLLLRSLGGAVPGAAGGAGAGAAGAGGGEDGKLSTFGELAADLLGPGKVSADDILALKVGLT